MNTDIPQDTDSALHEPSLTGGADQEAKWQIHQQLQHGKSWGLDVPRAESGSSGGSLYKPRLRVD